MTTTAMLRAFCDAVEQRNGRAFAELFTEDGIYHDVFYGAFEGRDRIAAMIDDGSAGHGDHKAIGGHHCHGCFSLAVAQPLQSTAATDIVAAHVARRTLALVGTAPDTDSPPPKHSA